MVKVKGVNIHPSQIDILLKSVEGVSSEYMVSLTKEGSKDKMILRFEAEAGADLRGLEQLVGHTFKQKIGIRINVEAVPMGALPRSEKKTKRIHDLRYQ